MEQASHNETGKHAMKTASKLLMKIYHDDNDADAMACMGFILTAEADGNVNFFLSSLDMVIDFCNKLKQEIIDESKDKGGQYDQRNDTKDIL